MECQTTSFLVATQCELTPLPNASPLPDLPPWPAQKLLPAERQELAVELLAGTHPVAELAREHQVSRKFLYQQAHTAKHALDSAFDPKPVDKDVLFYLPVTKAWLRQLILALVLICHSPYRGVVELLRDLFDWDISLGTVHNTVHSAVAAARAISQTYNLAHVRIGAHDEIFQAGHPVLVGVDTFSTYCYQLSLEDHRDAETWGVRLLELRERGFNPEATIADAGSALRAGQDMALPTVPCRGDVFHIIRDLETVATYLENAAYRAIDEVQWCQRQRDRTLQKKESKRRRSIQSVAARLRFARAACDPAVALADDVALLVGWLRHDVFAVAGPCYTDRCALYDFILAELKSRLPLCRHRLEPICRQLENQRTELLAFAQVLDRELEQLGQEIQVPPELLRQLPGEVRFVLGDHVYQAPNVQEACERRGCCLVASGQAPYPHTDPGVEVRRIFHLLRSRAIENFNEQFKAIFDVHGPVPTRGRRATERFALGAVFVYQLTLLHRHQHGLDLRVGLKAYLKAA